MPWKNVEDRRRAERMRRADRTRAIQRNLDRNESLVPVVPPCNGCPLVALCEQGTVCAGFLHWVRFGAGGLPHARRARGMDMSVWVDHVEADKVREAKLQRVDPWPGLGV